MITISKSTRWRDSSTGFRGSFNPYTANHRNYKMLSFFPLFSTDSLQTKGREVLTLSRTDNEADHHVTHDRTHNLAPVSSDDPMDVLRWQQTTDREFRPLDWDNEQQGYYARK